MTTLTSCFAAVPPSRLDELKNHARKCSEFAGVASSPAFAQALQTQSKVAESKCSGGSSCSTCPMRGNCEHGQGK
jgi:ferredoxin